MLGCRADSVSVATRPNRLEASLLPLLTRVAWPEQPQLAGPALDVDDAVAQRRLVAVDPLVGVPHDQR